MYEELGVHSDSRSHYVLLSSTVVTIFYGGGKSLCTRWAVTILSHRRLFLVQRVHVVVKRFLTWWAHNFVNNGPFLTNLVPMKSPELDLPIGSKFVKNGPLLTKLCTHKVRNPFITFELLSELLVSHYLLRWVMSLCTAVVTIFYGGRESLCSIDQLSHYVLRVPRKLPDISER